MDRPDYAVYLGLDIGKEKHYATGLDPSGTRVHDKPLPQARTRSTTYSMTCRLAAGC